MDLFNHKILVNACLTTAFVFTSFFNVLQGQNTILEVNLTDKDNNPASGTVTISGPETNITDSTFNGSATYILGAATAIDGLWHDKISIAPNPADGETTIFLPADLNYVKLTVSNGSGQTLWQGKLTGTVLINNPVKGILFFTLRTGKGQRTYKLLNTKARLIINTTLNIDCAKNKNILKASTVTAADDEYNVSFHDETGKLVDKSWICNIPAGTSYVVEREKPLFFSQAQTIPNYSIPKQSSPKEEKRSKCFSF